MGDSPAPPCGALIRRLSRLKRHRLHLGHIQVQLLRRYLQKARRNPLTYLMVADKDCGRVVGVDRNPSVDLMRIRLQGRHCSAAQLSLLRDQLRSHGGSDDQRAARLEKCPSL